MTPAAEPTLTIEPPSPMSGASAWMPSAGPDRVDGERLLEVVGGRVVQSRAPGDAGGVDEAVDAACRRAPIRAASSAHADGVADVERHAFDASRRRASASSHARSAAITRAPASASAATVAAPIPDAAPVTTYVRSSSELIGASSVANTICPIVARGQPAVMPPHHERR